MKISLKFAGMSSPHDFFTRKAVSLPSRLRCLLAPRFASTGWPLFVQQEGRLRLQSMGTGCAVTSQCCAPRSLMPGDQHCNGRRSAAPACMHSELAATPAFMRKEAAKRPARHIRAPVASVLGAYTQHPI